MNIFQHMLNESRKLHESVVTAEFGPGKYYIGDICYALKRNVYDKIWGDKYDYKDGEFEVEGAKFVVGRTKHGDGTFLGSDGVIYGVDAGVIGVVPEALWDPERHDSMEDGGRIVDVSKGLQFEAEDGNFNIDFDGEHVSIDTGDRDEEENEEEFDTNESLREARIANIKAKKADKKKKLKKAK